MKNDIWLGISSGLFISLGVESEIAFCFSSFLDPSYMHPVEYNVGKFGVRMSLILFAVTGIIFSVKTLTAKKSFSVKNFLAAFLISGVWSTFVVSPAILYIMSKIYIFIIDGVWEF